MLKGQEARLYYTVWSLATAEPVAGDLSSHTHKVYYCNNKTWSELSVTVEEVGNGVYTFTLSPTYTDVDAAVCRVESTNEAVMIPPIELKFDSIPDDTQTSIASTILETNINETTTLGSAISQVLTKSTSVNTLVSSMKNKFDLYPAPSDIPKKSDIPTVAQITAGVLSTNVPSSVGQYSVGAMVLGGFCSDLDPNTNTWTIRNTDNSVIATKSFVTSEGMKPIISVR